MRFPQVSERVKEAPAHALRAVFAGIGQLLLVTDRLRNRPAQEDQVPRPRDPEPAGQAVQTPVAGAPAASPAGAPPAAAPDPAAPNPAASAPAGTAAEDRAARQGGAAAGKATMKPGSQAAKAEKPVTAEERRRSLERTGNVRLLPDGAEAPAAGTPAAGIPAAKTPAGKPVTADAPAAEMPAAGTPAPEMPAAGTPAAEAPAPQEAAAPAASAGAEPPIPNYEQLSLASLRARLRGLTLVQVRELIVYERANAGRQDVIAMYERRVAKLESPDG